MDPCGGILAGGRASRMGGGDKALLRLGGVAPVDRVIARLAPPVAALAATPRGPQDTRSMAGDVIRHPVCGLWPMDVRTDLRAALASGHRKAAVRADGHGARVAVFHAANGADAFFNVNTPDDLRAAEALV